jgi:hypothetical protein
MNKNDILLILLALFLLTAVLVTIFFGGNRSRHGYGSFSPAARGPADTIARHCHSPDGDLAIGLSLRLQMV